jgi:tetratricopeptide (TPR) repeat protein
VPQPSFTPGKPSIEMARFTNRETEQAVFAHYVNLPAGHLPRLPALVFFGVGGIGKSWLLRHLQGQLSSVWHGVPSVRIDFTLEGASNLLREDPLSALAAIREITQAPCPRFDLAYGFLQVHRGVREESSLEHAARRRAVELAHEAVKGALGLIPGIGSALQSGYSILEKLYPYLKSKTGMDPLAALLQGHVKLLRDLPPEEIERRLVWWVAQDLKGDGVLPLRTYHAVQAVVFVDTLEAVVQPEASDARLEIRTRWLRDLICELNDRVLFVLAGQNRLGWDRIHPDWAEESWLEQRVVNGLSQKDAAEFLARCGFRDPAVQRAMLGACVKSDGAYHTFHLGLIADLGWVEREVNGREVTPALFSTLPPGDWTALTLRFLKCLAHQSDADWLRKLAFTPEFDERAARAAHSASPSQVQDSHWRMLQSFSFLVRLRHRGGWWTIHSAMQRAVLEDVASREGERWREMHAWWYEYWQGRTSDPTDEHARLAWCHRWHLDPPAALSEWNEIVESVRTVVPADMAVHHRLLSWWQPIRLLEQRHWTEFDASAAVSFGVESAVSTLGERGENLRRAIACYERALEVRTREAYPRDWAMTQYHLASAWQNRSDGDRGKNLRQAIDCCERALEVFTRQAYPQDWAITQNNLANAWQNRPDGDRGTNVRQAIACYERALEVCTRGAHPWNWAMTQNNLGNAWRDRPDGERGANLRQAIACYERALEVYTRDAYPWNWAMTQNNLANAWQDLPDGDRGENLRQAIARYERALEVCTREAYPQDWATTQDNLGNAWQNRPDGERGANLRQAIACFERALEVRTREAYPQDWAVTQNNLGNAWRDRPDGERGANLRQAIACYARALEVYTRDAYPWNWAMSQNNLGTAWQDLPDGDRGENLRQAIACFERALEVCTQDAHPQNCAMVQYNLGIAWQNRPDGDQGENVRQAIACYERALEVYTREAYPHNWALAQNNLGIAWQNRPDGDRGENLRQAIVFYERALEVCTRDAYPQDWAMAQNNLGNARRNRPDGDRGENLRQAIACFERALEVRTREAYPQDWAVTQKNLGIALQNRPDGERGENLRQAIACYERALEVYTREAYPQRWAVTQNNLGTAWQDRPDGDQGENVRRAIACYERALEVYTREAYPHDWAATQNNLGTAWEDRPDGDEGENLRRAIACYERALEVYTREAYPHDWVMAQENLDRASADLAELRRQTDSLVCPPPSIDVQA